MIEPQSITVSLEWAKKLKEAGWKQIGFFWKTEKSGGITGWSGDTSKPPKEDLDWIAAPTAEEILRRLPHQIVLETHPLFLQAMPDGDEWKIAYWTFRIEKGVWKNEDSLANAAAAMWCYLEENNLLPS